MEYDCVMAFVFRWDGKMEPLYLLLKRNTELGGYWQPVTGFIETEDSSLSDAALREVEEETGLSDFTCILDPQYTFTIHMNGTHCSVGVIVLETHSENRHIDLSFEHTRYRWAHYEAARELLYWENNKKMLDRIHRVVQNQSSL